MHLSLQGKDYLHHEALHFLWSSAGFTHVLHTCTIHYAEPSSNTFSCPVFKYLFVKGWSLLVMLSLVTFRYCWHADDIGQLLYQVSFFAKDPEPLQKLGVQIRLFC